MTAVSFQTIDGRHYLCADRNQGGLVVADRDKAQGWEEFEMVRGAAPGTWGLLASNGKWVSAEADGRLVARRTEPADWTPEAWEAFTVTRLPDGRVTLRSDHGRYVCAESGGGGTVIADRPAANAWEAFLPSRDFLSGGGNPGQGVTLSGRISVTGRAWVTSAGVFRPCFTSALSILRRSSSERVAFLDWARATGFNGVRVFAGALTWANQSPELARDVLAVFLSEASARNLYVEVVALTDTRTGYDARDHARRIADICARFTHTLFELANEPWHPSQSDYVHDPNNLLALRRELPGLAASLGAPATDEPASSLPTAEYLTLHLDRGRDKWNMVRRVRELENASATFGKPVLNNEPIGADENRATGGRLNDPSIFFCMGALNRLFEVGGVHHSQHGLDAVLPSPVQQACAEAHLAGWRAANFTPDRLTFKNAGWADSPIKAADFNQVVRAYSGIRGNDGVLVLVGLRGDPKLEMQGGWRLGSVMAEMSGCRVQELHK